MYFVQAVLLKRPAQDDALYSSTRHCLRRNSVMGERSGLICGDLYCSWPGKLFLYKLASDDLSTCPHKIALISSDDGKDLNATG